ncbi:adenosylmethionine--8-amino-7-oxononanoate transaminase [Acidovorax sp. SDU_ACID1]|uniref:adenosylmethionine--8-amino-7-oxononanoate transaminase n=1 Tax=Acidovorax sp. SDU_ACID1 TaxID=3136632 RepID=UPI00387337AD
MQPHKEANWRDEGLNHVWLPYTQMKSAVGPLPAVRTRGSRIQLADGRTLIDGIASWWSACHRYNPPHVVEAIQHQLAEMPHVMFGGLVNEPALRLATRLTRLLGGGLERVFFSDSGSVAVEVALKMVLQFWINRGETQRTRFVAFKGAYHGDTLGTMAIGDQDDGMHATFKDVLVQHDLLALPCDESSHAALEQHLARHAGQLAGIIVEPLVQGAGGMLMHSADVLSRLRALADKYGLLFVLDEVFTGFGRTGSMFAFQQAPIFPDILVLSKALSAGTLPLAATVASRRVFDGFWSDDPAHALMHGPTFMGNALACAAANASLDLFEQHPKLAQVTAIERALRAGLAPLADRPWVRDVRVLGAIGVVELHSIGDQKALRHRLVDAGVWIRPFGNIVYLTPALTIPEDELQTLLRAVQRVVGEAAP